ncbi:MAG: glycerate kinase [Limnohabitans sp.]|nr:glycerate kinase [Limnohabitans sp.]
MSSPKADPSAFLRALFDAAVASAQPHRVVPPHLPDPASLAGGRLIVIGAGKASAAMARAVEDHWSGPLSGLVVTRDGHEEPCERIEIALARHPVPDARGLAAAERMLGLVRDLTPQDFVLCLISGGGSALLPLPAEGLSLADKQELNQNLLKSGATITEMNTVRRHLSRIKGGRLAAACHPARVLTLVISDVPGDGLHDIASGPTVADPTTCADALGILQRYAIPMSPRIRELLERGEGESLKAGDPRLARCETRLISSPQMGLEAAARVAQAQGVTPCILGDSLEGEAREVGRVMAGIARQVAQRQQPVAAPAVLLSGGETTVTVRGQGCGGRNVEFLLSLGLNLQNHPRIHALAADTDGVDGGAETAGAFWHPETLARARALGLSAQQALDQNDAHPFFAALGQDLVSGPTRTNINDLRAIFIDAA